MKKPRLRRSSILFATIMLVLVGCSNVGEGSSEESGLSIITTFYPVYEFTSQVVGEEATITNLLSAGQDSHSYEPTPKDMAIIADADVFIYSSEYMETWVPDVLKTIEDSDVLVIEATEDISLYESEETDNHEDEEHDSEEDDHDHNHAVDPHVWLDPSLAQEMVSTIASALTTLDTENAAAYESNAESYIQELEQLNEDYETAFSNASNRTFVVQHAAFGYLARKYDLLEVPISSLTSDQEVSPAKMAEIGNFIKEHNMEAIYYQDSSNSKIAETLASETGVELEVLSSIEGITESDQEQGADYLSIMRSNLEALKKTIK